MAKEAFPSIPGYRVTGKLGEGGMATVYSGIQEKLNRKVAIKILEPSLLKSSQVAARFLIEAETAANLYHSNIISIYDIGHTDQHEYIVMEFLKETLKDYMLGYPGFRIKPETAFTILKPIVDALDYAHGSGIIHRDIKTDNIMFRGDGTPVLMDFGIARALESDSQMTRTGISLGTPYYMSPEQCKAQKLDGRSDFYSLGVVMYEILTGNKPYVADNPTAVALQHIQDPIPKLPAEMGLVPYQLLIEKMMAKDREDRVANGKELKSLMDTLVQAGAANATPAFSQHHEPAPQEELHLDLGDDEEAFDLLDLPLHESDPKPPKPQAAKTQVRFEPPPGTTVTPAVEEEDDDFDILDEALEDSAPRAAGAPAAVKRSGSAYYLKLVIESIILMGLLLVIFIIFYNLGQDSHPNNENQRSAAEIRRQREAASLIDAQYKQDLSSASQYIKNGDLVNARTVIARLKGKGQTQQLKELEDRLSDEMSFRDYYRAARNYFSQRNYPKARESVLLARAIKLTPELENLGKRIQAALARSKRGDAGVSARQRQLNLQDDRAFKVAQTEDSIEAFRKYLEDHPSGRHLDQAISRISKLREAFRLRQEARLKAAIPKIHLRSGFKTLNYSLAEAMIREYNFFDNGFNKNGNFKNYHEKQTIGGGSVVLDRGTGLMWYDSKSSKALSFRKADRWVRYLNRRKYAGFNDWRMPTLEEAASLLEKRITPDGLHISPAFRNRPKNCWTGDSLRLQTKWVVRFNTGTIFADSDRSKQQVIAVRRNR
jgi:serine/threonine protein kinase